MTEQPLAEALAAGLWRRVRDVLLVAERIDGFVFGPGEEPRSAVSDGEEDAVARDFVVRALAAASDALNWRILEAAASEDGTSVDAVAAMLDRPRLVAAERVNDLIQVGLVARALDTDAVRATGAGDAVARLIRDAAAALAQTIAQARARKERKNDGLSLL